MARDISDPAKVKRAGTLHKISRKDQLKDFKALLSTYQARAFFWRLLSQCKMHSFGYCGDNNRLNNMEGQRSIGGWVEAEIFDADPEAYTLMRSEAVSRDTRQMEEDDG